MKKFLASVLVVSLGMTITLIGLSQVKRSSNIKLKVKFVYCDPEDEGYGNCIATNKIRNDVYYEYVDGVDRVGAVFNMEGSSKDLLLDLNSGPRSSTLDLFPMVPESSGQFVPSWQGTTQKVQWFINVHRAYDAKAPCAASATACQNEMITEMTSIISKAEDARVNYALYWHPGSQLPVNSPYSTAQVKVLYNKDLAGKEVWTITPLNNHVPGPIAGLFNLNNKNYGPAGQYCLPFTLTAQLK